MGEIGGDEGLGHPRQRGVDGGEEDREGDDPWLVHDQDAPEAGDQGGEKGDLRQDGDGQGKASQDHRQGLRGGGAQEVGLSSAWYFCPGLGRASVARGGPTGGTRGVAGFVCMRGSACSEVVHWRRFAAAQEVRIKKKKKKKKKVLALIPLL